MKFQNKLKILYCMDVCIYQYMLYLNDILKPGFSAVNMPNKNKSEN